MDDLGLTSETLVRLKQEIYLQGLGQQIDSGAWNELPEDHRLECYNHAFLWEAQHRRVVGSIFHSKDGRKRSSYPLIIAVEGQSIRRRWLLRQAVELINGFEPWRMVKNTAEELTSHWEEAQRQLQGAFERQTSQAVEPGAGGLPAAGHDGAASEAPPNDQPSPIKRLINDPRMVGQPSLRLLYRLDASLNPAASPPVQVGRAAGQQPSLDARVPACGDTVDAVLRGWGELLEAIVGPRTPRFIIWPRGKSWVDLILGTPQGPEFFCIRAKLEALAMTSEIPYELDNEFVARAKQLLRRLGQDEPEPTAA
jgi:hypothetical protein